MYESDVTKFIRQFLQENPEVVEDQAVGRALWWDKKLDLSQLKQEKASRVPQTPYVYQSLPTVK